MITYEELSKMVPEETKKFIDAYLPLEYYYIINNEISRLYTYDDEIYTISTVAKRFYLLLYTYCLDYKNSLFFSQFGFDNSFFKFPEIKRDENGSIIHIGYYDIPSNDSIFTMGSYFSSKQNKYNYYELTPLDIILKAYKDYSPLSSDIVYNLLLPKVETETKFKNAIKRKNDDEKKAKEMILEKELFKDFPISVISYLETASKIWTILYSKDDNSDLNNERNLTVLSLFFALYYYKDPIIDEDNINMQKIMKKVIKKKGLDYSDIMRDIDIYIYENDVEKQPRNLYVIRDFYIPYIEKAKSNGQIDVLNIINNIWDRNFTETIYFEKLLAKHNCYMEMFYDFSNESKKEYQNEKRKIFEDTLSSFYDNMSTEVKDFIETSSKIYQLLIEKMKDNNHNNDILGKEDDADTLAILISSYYSKTEIARFYEDYNITLDKIMELLKISITMEEINSQKINPKILVNRFRRFVKEGVNSSKSMSSISINDISDNLCDRDFNKSMIMENIFYKLSNGKSLKKDFYTDLKKHLKEKEEIRRKELSEVFFKDMTNDVISYLEKVSIVYNNLINKSLIGYTKEDIKSLSLLLAFYTEDNKLKGFLEYMGLSLDNLKNYIPIDISNFSGNVDIDVLIKEFSPFVFEGYNKDKKSEDITLLSLLSNTFNSSLYKSIGITKLLGKFDYTCDDFKDLKKDYEEYELERIQKEKDEAAKERIRQYSYPFYKQLESVVSLYSYLKENKKDLEEDVLLELPMIIISFEDSLVKKFFEKHGITEQLIIEKYHLEEAKENHYLESTNYLLIEDYKEYLKKYDNKKGSMGYKDFIKSLFDEKITSNGIIKELLDEKEYLKLKQEIISEKDYESSLSMTEKMELLRTQEIAPIDNDNIESILNFGNELVPHAKYIYEELPRLVEQDREEDGILAIQEIMDRIYQREEPKKNKNIFMRLFKKEEGSEEITLDKEVLKELRSKIDENIIVLSKELLGYDAIRKYMEVYRKKNLAYLSISKTRAEGLQSDLELLNPENEDEYPIYLRVASLLQIMKDKVNRFQTTNHITSQELIRINQAIVNHFITINALEMAKNDLFPLIASELTLAKGRDSEKEALELSHGVMNLFQALLSRNVEEAKNHLEIIKRSNVPQELLDSLNSDIISLTTNIKEAKLLEEKSSGFSLEELNPTKKEEYQKKK